MPENRKPVKTFTQIIFFLILGLFSTFFAEVLSGSKPDFLIDPFGYFGVLPLYALHSIVVTAFALSTEKPVSLRSLYFISLFFGMYEAYITKVIWDPFYGETAFHLANIAVVDTLVLVLFWHAVMSFIIPLIWAEELLATSNRLRSMFPKKWQQRIFGWQGIIVLGIFGSLMVGQSIADPGDVLALVVLDCLSLIITVGVWKLFTRKKSFILEDLLPGKRGRWIFTALLVTYYLIFGLTLRREVHPGFVGHFTVLVLYGGIAALVRASLRMDKADAYIAPIRHPIVGNRLNFKHLLLYCAVFILSAFLVNLLPYSIERWVFGLAFFSLLLMGLLIFFRSLRALFTKTKNSKTVS